MGLEYYFLWSGVSLGIFYLFYMLLLKRETFFVFNRVYLLVALCLSMLMPFLDLSWLIVLPKAELVTNTLAVVGVEKLGNNTEKELNCLNLVYWIGVVLSATRLFIKIAGVKKQLTLPKDGDAFSFWKTKVIDRKLSGLTVIDAHENIHVKQLHTFDLLLVEIVGVFFWFNPIVYAYRKSLKLIHEYLADEYACNFTASKKQYAMLLFLQNLNAGPILANTFYSTSLLESRIKMLQRKRSNHYRLWKYVLCLPLTAVLCSFNTSGITGNTNKVDQSASFPGGFDAFSKYLIGNAKKVSSKNGRVIVSFFVQANGEISNEKIEKSLDQASDKEALRLIKACQKWKPALQNGEKVSSAYQIAINFNSDNQIDKL
ncbi:M56 family metallopeptidase [Pedobacter aquatilis]|uniref:M56 family metallopeptidase n=1 Tax=Pedobacter aquatilis TaxID=351343 RepID=UPI00292D7530|nr:M56 family metallopeptidase [Pedobacter aquatilis]